MVDVVGTMAMEIGGCGQRRYGIGPPRVVQLRVVVQDIGSHKEYLLHQKDIGIILAMAIHMVLVLLTFHFIE